MTRWTDNQKVYEERHYFAEGIAEVLVKMYGLRWATKVCNKIERKLFSKYLDEKYKKEKHQKTKMVESKCYARALLAVQSGLKVSEIPQELAEVKRIQLTIKRMIKGLGNEKH